MPLRAIPPDGPGAPMPSGGARTTTWISCARSTVPSGATRRSAYAGVGMQPGDVHLHHEDVEYQAGEAEQLNVVGPSAAPPGSRPGVQERGVKYPGDEGPRFHGIPAPVAPPGLVRPDRTGDDAESPYREPEHYGPVGE